MFIMFIGPSIIRHHCGIAHCWNQGHVHPYPARMLGHWQVLKELQISFGESREPLARRGCCRRAVASRQVQHPC